MDVSEADSLTRDYAQYSASRKPRDWGTRAGSGSSILWISSALLAAALIGSLMVAFS